MLTMDVMLSKYSNGIPLSLTWIGIYGTREFGFKLSLIEISCGNFPDCIIGNFRRIADHESIA